MDLATFRRLLEQCGTNLEAWPDGGGEAALEFLAASEEARSAYLDAFPDAADRSHADDGEAALVERIMGVVADEPD